MTSFAITGIYASLLALLMMFLGMRVSLTRARTGISLLTGDDKRLAERVRMHANLTETVPMAIILMGIAEAQGAAAVWLHATGLMLLAARLIHPLGIDFDRPSAILRPIGMAGTLIAMLMSIGYILWHALG